MNSNDWMFLKILGEELNLTKAAKKLFVTQPTLTEKIRKLEKEFECQLIVRNPRGITLTSEGEVLVRYAGQSLKQYYQLKDDIASMKKDELHGYLRIGCSNVFAKYHLPALLVEFHRFYPNVEINCTSGFSHRLYHDFLRNELQAVIIRGDRLWNEKKSLLLREPLCIFSKKPLKLEKLPEYPYVHYNTEPGLQAVFDDWWFGRYRSKPYTITNNDDMGTVMKMVQENIGYTILSESCGSEYTDLYKYVLKRPDGSIIYRNTWLCARNGYESISVLRAFINLVLKRYPVLDD